MAVSDRPGMLFWSQAPEADRQRARTLLSTIITNNVEELVQTFYSAFLAHAEASAFLSHSVVNERLTHSMRNWLLELVQFDPCGDLAAFDERQKKIGEIHGRLKIPNNLVMEGMTLLKTEISVRAIQLDPDAKSVAETIILLGEAIDYAMRLMTAAYVSDTNLRAQTDEAFRLFSLGQDITLEREKQRAALMEWSQSVLFGLLGLQTHPLSNPLSASPFGLWIRHRASVLFQGSDVLAQLVTLMHEIDTNFIRADEGIKPTLVADLHRRIDEMKFLLNDLFQNAAEIENGRDPLTRTLNRRFLPSVVGREITLAKKSSTPLSILMADLDRFKSINDQHGHSAGDLALCHAAEILLNSVRPSDFVFRYGGEEFLIILVETGQREAQLVAEHIRAQVEGASIPISDREAITATISIGVATYEGHPDYQYLINAADRALYTAKKEGRNRVATAVAA